MQSDTYEEYASPEEDLALHKYFEENFPFQSLLDSYNHSYQYEFGKCLQDKTVPLANKRYGRLRFIRIDPPPQSHEACLITDSTYAGNMIVRVEVYNSRDELKDTGPEFILMRIPIPVRCMYSLLPPTHPKDPEMFRDPGCYFVTNGIHRIVILYEKLRQNQFCLNRYNKTGEYSVRQLTEIPAGSGSVGSTSQSIITMSTEKVKGLVTNPIAMTNFDKQTADPTIDKAGKKELVGDTRFNVLEMVYVAYYFLGEDPVSDDDVVEEFSRVFQEIIPPTHLADCWTAFAPTVLKFSTTDLDSVVEKMRKAVKGKRDEKDDEIRHLIANGLHPNHRHLRDKIMMVITMTARLLQCYTGKIAVTDRNNWAHKSIALPGQVVVDLFRRKYSGAVIKISNDSVANFYEATDLMAQFVNSDIESKFMAEFMTAPGGGKKFAKGGGVSGAAKRTGGTKSKPLTQEIYPLNILDFWLNLTKTQAGIEKHSTDMLARALHLSAFRTIDALAVTDNDKTGIIKWVAALTQQTIPTDPRLLLGELLERRFKDNRTIGEVNKSKEYDLPVLINGLLCCYVNSKYGPGNCRMLKRYGIIDRRCCIVPTSAGVLEIYTDGNRNVRPVFVVGTDHRPRILGNPHWKDMSFTQWVEEGYIEYMDTYEFENPQLRIAETFMSFKNQEQQIEDLRRMIVYSRERADAIRVQNLEAQLRSAEEYRITHADLHPTTGYGLIVSILTYINNQQPCRSAFDMKLVTQIIHRLMGSSHALNNGLVSIYDFKRMLESGVSRAIGIQDLQGGEPAYIAILPLENNQEDAAVINKDSLDRGFFRHRNNRIFKDVQEGAEQHFGRYIPPDRHPTHFRHINANGLPTIGVRYRPGDCIINKYEVVMSETGVQYKKDRSTYLDWDETGSVEEVVTYTNNKSNKSDRNVCVKVLLSSFDRLEVGDKIDLFHAQKFTVGGILPGVDMPMVPHVYTGKGGVVRTKDVHVSAIFNPLCFVTRMTLGTLAGPMAMKATAGTGKIYDAGPHRKHNYVALSNMLLANGWSRDGKDECYHGITGKPITCPVMIGPSRIAKLKHIATKMMQSHGVGAKDTTTRQAKSSRKGISKDKGQKFSEYERVSALKRECHFIIDAQMNTSSDAHTIVVCRSCSHYALFDPEARQFTCKDCGSEKKFIQREAFGKYMLPYTSRYEQALLMSLGQSLDIKFVGKEEYLRSNLLNYGDADEGDLEENEDGEDGEDEGSDGEAA
jgi:DNA-directed RNA polymerase beta subunit